MILSEYQERVLVDYSEIHKYVPLSTECSIKITVLNIMYIYQKLCNVIMLGHAC